MFGEQICFFIESSQAFAGESGQENRHIHDQSYIIKIGLLGWVFVAAGLDVSKLVLNQSGIQTGFAHACERFCFHCSVASVIVCLPYTTRRVFVATSPGKAISVPKTLSVKRAAASSVATTRTLFRFAGISREEDRI